VDSFRPSSAGKVDSMDVEGGFNVLVEG